MPEERWLTIAEAAEKKKVSRQAMHLFVQRNQERCKAIGNKKKRAAVWLIPASLLKEYKPVDYLQAAGKTRAKNREVPPTDA